MNKIVHALSLLLCLTLSVSLSANDHDPLTQDPIDKELLRSIRVYPNPATTTATIDLSKLEKTDISIILMNAVFQEVQKIEYKDAEFVEIDLTDLSPGVYYLRFRTESGAHVKRLIKM
ncbi:MAG: T9SS type A sorting domain-containing protein [Bacteroidota bacterium]